MNIIKVHDIVEKNGKSVLQNNLERSHTIPLGSLVDVKYSTWHGEGACEKVHAHLWVVRHDRDCDGTPLYTLSQFKNPTLTIEEMKEYVMDFASNRTVPTYFSLLFKAKQFATLVTGISEAELTVLPLTDEVVDGKTAL
jgi:hypothetical protein